MVADGDESAKVSSDSSHAHSRAGRSSWAASRGPSGGVANLVRIDLTGFTVREALDRLVAEEPRHAWHVLEGAVVVRPAD